MHGATETFLIALAVMIAGPYFAYRNWKLMRNGVALRAYVETEPKAWLWRTALGVDRAVKLTRLVFLPFGILVSVGFFVVGFMIFASRW